MKAAWFSGKMTKHRRNLEVLFLSKLGKDGFRALQSVVRTRSWARTALQFALEAKCGDTVDTN